MSESTCNCTIHIAKVEVPTRDADRWIADLDALVKRQLGSRKREVPQPDRWLEEQDRKAKQAKAEKAAATTPTKSDALNWWSLYQGAPVPGPAATPAPTKTPTLRDVMRVAVAYVRATRFGRAVFAPLSAGHRHESQSGDASPHKADARARAEQVYQFRMSSAPGDVLPLGASPAESATPTTPEVTRAPPDNTWKTISFTNTARAKQPAPSPRRRQLVASIGRIVVHDGALVHAGEGRRTPEQEDALSQLGLSGPGLTAADAACVINGTRFYAVQDKQAVVKHAVHEAVPVHEDGLVSENSIGDLNHRNRRLIGTAWLSRVLQFARQWWGSAMHLTAEEK